MPNYRYKVKDKEGKVLLGRMDALNGRELRAKLDDLGYFIIEYVEKKSPRKILLANLPTLTRRVALEEIAIFSWQLYTMLNAGLTLTNTLKILERQAKNKYFKEVINEVCRRVEEGISFSESLKQHPEVFSSLYVHMVNAGEVGGVLDEMLRRMAVYYEEQSQVNSRIRLALAYPVFLTLISVMVVIFLITFVLPKFEVIFVDMGLIVPWSTKVLLEFSKFIKGSWVLLLGIACGIFLLMKAYGETQTGRWQYDKFLLTLPLIGDLVRKTTAARFTQTLSILVAGGIPILTALDVVTDVIDNMVVVRTLKEVASMVGEGQSIAKPLEDSNIFPPMVVSMVRVGEETGALDTMLEKVSHFYHREVDNAIQTFTKLIEPFLIVIMTVIIGFIAVSIFLPLADLMQGMHG